MHNHSSHGSVCDWLLYEQCICSCSQSILYICFANNQQYMLYAIYSSLTTYFCKVSPIYMLCRCFRNFPRPDWEACALPLWPAVYGGSLQQLWESWARRQHLHFCQQPWQPSTSNSRTGGPRLAQAAEYSCVSVTLNHGTYMYTMTNPKSWVSPTHVTSNAMASVPAESLQHTMQLMHEFHNKSNLVSHQVGCILLHTVRVFHCRAGNTGHRHVHLPKRLFVSKAGRWLIVT